MKYLLIVQIKSQYSIMYHKHLFVNSALKGMISVAEYKSNHIQVNTISLVQVTFTLGLSNPITITRIHLQAQLHFTYNRHLKT